MLEYLLLRKYRRVFEFEHHHEGLRSMAYPWSSLWSPSRLDRMSRKRYWCSYHYSSNFCTHLLVEEWMLGMVGTNELRSKYQRHQMMRYQYLLECLRMRFRGMMCQVRPYLSLSIILFLFLYNWLILILVDYKRYQGYFFIIL